MAGRSRIELEQVRATNRQALGMADYAPALPGPAAPAPWTGPVVTPKPRAGMAGTVPGLGASPLGMIGVVTVGAAFPPASYSYDPNAPASAASTSSGSAIVDWLNVHVFRPFVDVPALGFRWAPGDGQSDLSPYFVAGTVGVLGLGAIGGAWLFARAISPGRRTA